MLEGAGLLRMGGKVVSEGKTGEEGICDTGEDCTVGICVTGEDWSHVFGGVVLMTGKDGIGMEVRAVEASVEGIKGDTAGEGLADIGISGAVVRMGVGG